MRTLPLMLLLAALVVLPSAPVGAQTTGLMQISTDTTLAADHVGNIVINANNITLNCAGRVVTGPGTTPGSGSGILLPGRVGVTVENCHVRNFDDGIALTGSSVNVFRGNLVSGNRDGFDLNGSGGNIFIGNTATANVEEGFDLDDSDFNVFIGNDASRNGRSGFELENDSDRNTFLRNTATFNGSNGFLLQSIGTDSNLLEQNTAQDNDQYGFRSESARVNRFIGNQGCRNGTADASAVGSNLDHVYLDNTFCVGDPPELATERFLVID